MVSIISGICLRIYPLNITIYTSVFGFCPVLRNQKINAIASAAASGEKADACVIIVSGDMAYGGTKAEYSIAEDFLLELREQLEKRLSLEAVPFVIIPGNHDCVLKPANSVRETLIASIKAEPIKVNDSLLLESCMSVQQAYFDFANFLNGEKQKRTLYI